jgi:chemotaxis protein MotB
MISLLLTFFVLLISYSTIETKKFTIAMTSLRGSLGVLTMSQGVSLPISRMPMLQIGKGRIDQIIEEQVQQIKEDLQKLNMQDMIKITQTRDQLHFTISEPLLFESGRADIRAEADSLLRVIADILNLVPFEIRVEGHTDDRPISTARFPSNWELSFGRGLALSQRFIHFGVRPERFQIVGYGENRPIADNATPQGRALNRRVELIINLQDEIRRSLLPGD